MCVSRVLINMFWHVVRLATSSIQSAKRQAGRVDVMPPLLSRSCSSCSYIYLQLQLRLRLLSGHRYS